MVKRFDTECDQMVADEDGEFVFYQDYAALDRAFDLAMLLAAVIASDDEKEELSTFIKQR